MAGGRAAVDGQWCRLSRLRGGQAGSIALPPGPSGSDITSEPTAWREAAAAALPSK